MGITRIAVTGKYDEENVVFMDLMRDAWYPFQMSRSAVCNLAVTLFRLSVQRGELKTTPEALQQLLRKDCVLGMRVPTAGELHTSGTPELPALPATAIVQKAGRKRA